MEATTTRQREVLKFVYETFATDTAEVAAEFGISQEAARKELTALQNAGVIVSEAYEDRGGMLVSGAGITEGRSANGQYASLIWQCWNTYDSVTWEECLALAQEKGVCT